MLRISDIKSKKILVIGDVMLDKYFLGEVKRISPEAPVPVFRKRSERSVLGGAANVAANLVAAKQTVSVMSIIGDDDEGKIINQYFCDQEIDSSLIITINRETTVKTRFLASNNQQVLRLDSEDTTPISKEECSKLLSMLMDRISDFDVILLSDYLKGLLTPDFTQGVLQMAAAKGIPAIIDVKDPHIEKYHGAYLLKPNLKEIRDLTGMPARTDEEIIEAAEVLRKNCGCKYVLCTCGARGMVLVGENHQPFFIASEGREVFDVSGAGDTTISYLAACMANGFEMNDAVMIANYAAGIQVGKLGTSSVYLQEIRDYLSNKDDGTYHKILHNEEDILSFRENHADKKVVFTNGCFDILHVGHKRYLQQASTLGDILIVGVNSDASVKRLKGPDRPVNCEQDRMEMLCAMGFIDYVVLFEEDTPYELIKKIQPDVLVKGGDYAPDQVVGKDIVEARGGRLELIKFVDGKSTTNIIKKINTK